MPGAALRKLPLPRQFSGSRNEFAQASRRALIGATWRAGDYNSYEGIVIIVGTKICACFAHGIVTRADQRVSLASLELVGDDHFAPLSM